MQATRSGRCTAAMPSRASPLPHRHHWPLEQIDCQHRRRMIGLATHQPHPANQRYCDQAQAQVTFGAMYRRTQTQYQQGKQPGTQDRRQAVEGVPASGNFRQRAQAQHNRQQPQRHIDQIQPMPGGHRQNSRRRRRPQGKGQPHHQRVVTQAPTEDFRRINVAQQRDIHAHDRCSAQPLHHPRCGQRGQRPGQPAEQRGDDKHQQTAEKHPSMAQHIAERGKRQHRGDGCQLVGIDHPDHRGGISANTFGQGWQGRVDDGGIQGRHADPQGDRDHGGQAFVAGQAIGN
jgi:hypothetical protein